MPRDRLSTPAKLAAFAALLAVLFGAAALAGAAIGPVTDDGRANAKPDAHSGMDASGGGHEPSGAAGRVRGLAVAEGGLRVVVEDAELRRGRTERLAFRIVDEHGETVRDFDVEHTRRMHLILAGGHLVALRDGDLAFLHVHPTEAGRGDAVGFAATFPTKGRYRLLLQFQTPDPPARVQTAAFTQVVG